MLKLIFSGEIIAGYERDQVVANLARVLKQPPEAIDKNLFSGRPVVVKRVESDALARKWIKTFADAGALLQSMPLAVQSPADSPSKQPRARRRHKAFLVLGVITLIVLAALVFLLWATRPLWQSAELNQHQQAIVNALVSEDIYALGHINIDHIQSLEVLAQRETDLAALPGADQDFWGSLEQAGISVREQVTHAWAAGYYSATQTDNRQKGDVLLVLTGEFNLAQIGQWLKQRYIVEAENADGYMVTWLDEQSCEKQPARQVVVSNSQILVGSPAQIAQFQKRLQDAAQAVRDLTFWQKNHSAQLASLAVFVPQNVGAAIGGFPRHMLKEAAATAAPASGLYFGLDPVSLPPGVELSAVITSEDAPFLLAAHDGVNARLQEAKTEAAQNWPEILPLFDRLTVSQNDNQLRAAIRFDENFQHELGNLISAFFTTTFSIEDSNTATEEEQLDANPPQFSTVADTSFPSFTQVQYLDEQFVPVSVAGPFGIELKHLEIGEDGLGIALNFRAFDLPNVDSLRSGLTMRITDVLDAAGKSLAPVPTCGPDKIRKPVEISSTWSTNAYIDGKEIPYTAIAGSTTVTLPQSVTLAEIKALTGVFDYHLPRGVETIELKAPLAGQVIEKYDLRLRFFNSAEGSLRYEYSGNVDALLHVAGLNADGKALARNSSMRSGIIFGSGQSVSADYKGKVTGARVILANELTKLSYPFEVTSLQPPAGDSSWPLKPQPVSVNDKQWRALQTDAPPAGVKFWRDPHHVVNTGPILLAIQDVSFSEHFGMQMEVEAYLNNQHPLVGITGSVEVAVTEIDRVNGEIQALELKAQFPLDYDGGYWMNGTFMPNEDSPWLRGKAQMRDREIKFVDAKSLRGTVTLTRALATESIYFPAVLGTTWANEDLTVQMVRWEKGRLVFSVTGDISNLVSIQAIDAEGAIVSQPVEPSWMFGKAEFAVDIQAVPQQLVLVVATTADQAIYPFEIILPD